MVGAVIDTLVPLLPPRSKELVAVIEPEPALLSMTTPAHVRTTAPLRIHPVPDPVVELPPNKIGADDVPFHVNPLVMTRSDPVCKNTQRAVVGMNVVIVGTAA